MKNKAINHSETSSVDSLKNSKSKLPGYLKAGALVVGSTLASFQAANAVDVSNNLTADDNEGNAYVFNIASKILTVTSDNSGSTNISTISLGAVSDTATGGSMTVISAAADTVGLIVTLASVLMNNAGTPGEVRFKDVDGAGGNMVATVSGVFTHTGGTGIQTLETTTADTLTVNFDGITTMTLISNLTAANGTKGHVNAKFSSGAIFTAGLDMQDSATTAGSSTATFDGAGTQAIAGAIDGNADNMGTLAVTNTGGKVSFAGAMGGNNAIKNITVGTAADDSLASFAAAVSAQTITVQGGNAAVEDSRLEFGAAVTGAVVLTAGVEGDAIVDFLDDNAITALTGAITATSTSGARSTVRIYDGEGSTAAVNTITGAVGTANNRIGTLQIGADSDGGSGNINGAVAVTNLNINSGTATNESSLGAFAAAIDAVTITLTDASDALTATLELDENAAATVLGTIDGNADNKGILKISGTGKIISGVVGGIKDLKLIDLDHAATFNSSVSALGLNLAAGKASTIKGDLTIGASNAVLSNATSQLFIAGAGNQTITGQLTGATAETGIVDVTNAGGTVTFASAMGTAAELKEVELNAGSVSIFNSTVKTGILDMIGTAKATFTAKASVANQITLAATATMIIDDTIVTTDELFTTGAAQADGNIAGTDNIKMPVNLDHGQTIVFLAGTTDAADAAIQADLQLAIMDTAVKTYSVGITAATNDNDITVTASDKSADAVATSLGATKDVGTAFLQAVQAVTNDTAADAAAEDTFGNLLSHLGGNTAADVSALALQVAPQTDSIGGSSIATKAMTGTVQGIVSNRMASLRSGDAFVTGMSAGNGMSANSGFIQAFGSEGEQENITAAGATTFGFDTETSGLAIGFDGMTEDGSTIGLSASYSTTDVDGKGSGKSKNSIDSYTVTAYADKATEIGYIEGSLTYGVNDNTASRVVNTAGFNRTYSGSYDSQQISLKVGGGMPNEVKDGTFITPFANATVTNTTTDAYTEKSSVASDVLRLNVAQDDINSVVATLGVKAHAVTDFGTPMISLAVNNEFGDSKISSSNTYQGGGTKFKSTTSVEELSATLGLGYSFGNDVTSLNINYEANANDEEYVNHYGSVKIVAKF